MTSPKALGLCQTTFGPLSPFVLRCSLLVLANIVASPLVTFLCLDFGKSVGVV